MVRNGTCHVGSKTTGPKNQVTTALISAAVRGVRQRRGRPALREWLVQRSVVEIVPEDNLSPICSCGDGQNSDTKKPSDLFHSQRFLSRYRRPAASFFAKFFENRKTRDAGRVKAQSGTDGWA